MSLRLHIDRVVLDDPRLAGVDGRQLRAALEAELTRLFLQSGASAFAGQGAALPVTVAAPLSLDPAGETAGVGIQLAQSLHGSLAP